MTSQLTDLIKWPIYLLSIHGGAEPQQQITSDDETRKSTLTRPATSTIATTQADLDLTNWIVPHQVSHAPGDPINK